MFAGLVSCFSTDQKKLKRLECRTETFTYTSDESTLSRKAESAGEISDVRTGCAEFKPVGDACWGVDEAGSSATCSGDEVTP